MRATFVGLYSLLLSLIWMSPASADGCGGGSTAVGNGYVSSIHCASDPSSGTVNAGDGTSTQSKYTDYRWELSCDITVGAALTCSPPCPTAGELPYRLLGLANG